MWLNEENVTDSALSSYQQSLFNSRPNYVVIDGLFDETKLEKVMACLHDSSFWLTQKHTYSSLYVNNEQWEQATNEQRFVKRDVWRRERNDPEDDTITAAHQFLTFLRSDKFLSVLSRIFNVPLTDLNVAEPEINTNYFRLSSDDFVEQHADDSPGREVCMLLYLNQEWSEDAGGELVFLGENDNSIKVAPHYNRCILFNPSSIGSEHWVNRLNTKYQRIFRYNVTSWYWSE